MNGIQQQTMDLGSGVAYCASVSLCAIGQFLNEYASALTFLVGALLGIGTFAFNVYWKFRTEKKRYNNSSF